MKLREWIDVVLNEGRLDTIFARHKKRFAQLASEQPPQVKSLMARQQGSDDAERLFSLVVSGDPSGGSYVDWLVKTVVSGGMKVEDLDQAREKLEIFHAGKNRLPADQRDISRLRDIGALAALANTLAAPSQRQKKAGEAAKARSESEIIVNTPELLIVQPKTMEASCFYGRNTEWCVANSDPEKNMFWHYTNNGEEPFIVILFKRKNQRFGWAPLREEFVDENNSPVDMVDFLNEHPDVEAALTERFPDEIEEAKDPLDWPDDFTRGTAEAAYEDARHAMLDNGEDDDGGEIDWYEVRWDRASKRRLIRDCAEFQREADDWLQLYYEHFEEHRAGINFWLDRNGNGSGFMDDSNKAGYEVCEMLWKLTNGWNVDTYVSGNRIYLV